LRTAETGRLGEDAAAELLRGRGYVIERRNFRTRRGEIDIVASGGGFLVFAEVKTRTEGSMLQPREAVSAAKRRRILLAAEEYISLYGESAQPRFDVIEIICAPGEKFRVVSSRIIENAFGADE
jgi:putative endonuclease